MTAAAPVDAAPGLLDRFAGSTRALSAMRAPTVMAILTILCVPAVFFFRGVRAKAGAGQEL